MGRANPQVTAQTNVVLNEASEILDFNIPCLPKASELSAARSRQIRFHFTNCGKKSIEHQLKSIVNESNSYDATIFDLGEQKQSSDFIPLKDGPNRFKVVWTDSRHRQVETYYTFRRDISEPTQKR